MKSTSDTFTLLKLTLSHASFCHIFSCITWYARSAVGEVRRYVHFVFTTNLFEHMWSPYWSGTHTRARMRAPAHSLTLPLHLQSIIFLTQKSLQLEFKSSSPCLAKTASLRPSASNCSFFPSLFFFLLYFHSIPPHLHILQSFNYTLNEFTHLKTDRGACE